MRLTHKFEILIYIDSFKKYDQASYLLSSYCVRLYQCWADYLHTDVTQK